MRRRRPSIVTVAIATAVISLIVAACGGSSPHGTPSASRSRGHPTHAQIQQLQQDAVRFADCMRSHGVPTFPDPNTDPHAFKQAFSSKSPAFVSAATRCQHLMPSFGQQSESPAQTHAHTVALLAFARCIRGHGFVSFPDPTSSGQVTHEMIANAGINLHQPAVKQAADACVGVTHGAITRTMVARFIAGR